MEVRKQLVISSTMPNPKVLRYMESDQADGTLVVPCWVSAPWWPLLLKSRGKFRSEIHSFLEIAPQENMFIPAVPGLTMFGSGEPNFSIIALRLCFVGIIEPNLVCQSHNVIQEVDSALALY